MIYLSYSPMQQPGVAILKIVEGFSNEANEIFLDPQVITAVIGVDNTVQWISEDTVPQTRRTNSGYWDVYSELFDSRERPEAEGGPFIMLAEAFEFTFTQPEKYGYHGEPHP